MSAWVLFLKPATELLRLGLRLAGGVGLIMAMGCTAELDPTSAQAMRSLVLDRDVAAIAINLALAQEYAIYNMRESCRHAGIPEAEYAALRQTDSTDPRFLEQVADYEKTLVRIYKEERAFCDVYRQVVDHTDTLVRNALAGGAEPSADLYLFYATPNGIMRDVRVANDGWTPGMDNARAVDLGFTTGTWLGYELSSKAELIVGLFPHRADCLAARGSLQQAEVETKPCRQWSSEPIYSVQWERDP